MSLSVSALNYWYKGYRSGLTSIVSTEVVGMSPALKMGFELMRPWGIISSVGVHNAEVRLSVEKISFKVNLF